MIYKGKKSRLLLYFCVRKKRSNIFMMFKERKCEILYLVKLNLNYKGYIELLICEVLWNSVVISFF